MCSNSKLFNNEVDISYLKNVFESISEFIDQNKIICIKSTIHPEALDETLQSSKFSPSQVVFNPEFLEREVHSKIFSTQTGLLLDLLIKQMQQR